MTVRTRPKRAPAKAKSKGTLEITLMKKRNPPAKKAGRASKIQETVPKAKSGRRVNGKGASVIGAFTISDDDDDLDRPRQESRTHSLTPPRETVRISSPGSEDDLKPISSSTPTLTHGNNLEAELIRTKEVNLKEQEQLRHQLNVGETKLKHLKEDTDREVAELQRKHSITCADLQNNLEDEQRRSSDLTRKCDQLRTEKDTAHSRLQGETILTQQRDDYERLYKEAQSRNAGLERSLLEKDDESARRAAKTAEETQSLVSQFEGLQREVTQLRGEVAALKTSSASRSRSSASPALEQGGCAADQELRLANMRSTYIKVKKRYDNLHSVARNVSTATWSWDYGCFGEFGLYLRQLKTALGENGCE